MIVWSSLLWKLVKFWMYLPLYTGLFTRGVFLNFFLPQPIIQIATISWFQILKIIITESTTALIIWPMVDTSNTFYINLIC
jgi:hypothetical protein